MGQINNFPITTIRGSEIPSLVTVTDAMTTTVTQGGVTRRATHLQIKNDINSDMQTNLVRTGAGIPVAAPDFIGQRYIDTTNGWRYTATGTGAVSDWHLEYAYGTFTITAGGGDITTNLGGNWINGKLEVFLSDNSIDYFMTTVDVVTEYKTTYDSLTNAAYTARHNLDILPRATPAAGNQNNILRSVKTVNDTGVPKSATTTSFTLNDDGANTRYTKWVINA